MFCKKNPFISNCLHFSPKQSCLNFLLQSKYGSTQFYTQKKVYLIKPNLLKPLPQINGIKMIYKGNPSHYQYIREYRQKFVQGQKLYSFHKEKIDIAAEMMKIKKDKLTYITMRNYESVCAVPKPGACLKNIQQIQDIKIFLDNFQFQITKSYLDLHPLQAYWKICSLVGNKIRQKSIENIFTQTTFSLSSLKNNTIILPFVRQLNQKYLNNETELKLRKLDRRDNIPQCTLQQAHQSIKKWQDTFLNNFISTNINWRSQIYSIRQKQQLRNMQICLNEGLGQYVTIEEAVEGYGQNQFYALWRKDE